MYQLHGEDIYLSRSLFAWIVIKIKSKYLWKYGQMLRLSSNNIIFTPLIAAKIASMIDARQE